MFRVRYGEMVLIGGLLVCLVSCDDPQHGASVRDRMASGRSATSADSDRTTSSSDADHSGGPAIAIVNGRAIPQGPFVELLVRSHGLDVLRRWMLRDLVREEAKRLGLTVTRADVDAEYDRMWRAAVEQTGDGSGAGGRDAFVDELLRLRGWTREELDLVVERQAYLRRVAESQVQVTEEEIRKEFERTRGERVQVRHVQLASARACEGFRRRLADGESFESVSAETNENLVSRAEGGMMAPFTRDDPDVPRILREAAFALNFGQVSNPIEYEGGYHLIQLVARIPAESADFDQVRADLERRVRDRLVTQRMNALLARLMTECRLWIEDSTLREQYETARKESGNLGPPLSRP